MRAAAQLRWSSWREVLVDVDCEAQDPDRPGGVLALISLSDLLAKHLFFVDALAFPSTHPRPTLRFPTSLALLSLPHITKVSWDGRADVLHLCYGLVLSDVRQVQLVDASSRVRNSTIGQPVSNILRGFLKPLRAEIERNPALNADIYALRGLEHAIFRFQLLPNNRGQTLRDPAVAAATHASCGSALQLVRLPPTLHIRRA
ncbi:uncharacterized protein TRAVEDRAFT_52860 [Trametes versicolor FP-101664 SS1]|uniref:uncharacterized protein n=1 Tax=Trametes versicolor (strain FP-101664) TaxID=717944 RepID=UPI0004623F46|nr:uncharacterized protein TRAVEDRAFT_52860 [Trametes versicolor FP-101664 SS1]EIW53737.1 hypothetical protein TRAVEDRAFT_52860 [Trametes versicolor FP-101664 SS1]